ncbi:MAG: precorrin-3B C(17)-methyltransferase, partial [Spirochaetia bacterium]|nr:precorrin-3B C(17)-methyltransferase [Spirochaetia bacterium]
MVLKIYGLNLNATSKTKGKIFVIGIGPGSEDHMTVHALKSLALCDVIIGYDTYIDLIAHLLKPSQEIFRAGMTEEVLRAQKAVEVARSKKTGDGRNANQVAIISSGDSGLYGMAGLVFEVIEKTKSYSEIDVEIVPGVTALVSAASLLGSPVMHDFCAISLSDHLTSWSVIEKRLELAALGDFVIALYNPKSARRKEQIIQTRDILSNHRSPDNVVGMVTSAYRKDQNIVLTDLHRMLDHPMGMMTTIIIGNSETYVSNGKMITPRGYHKKYNLEKTGQSLKISERMNPVHEPWSLTSRTKDTASEHIVNNDVIKKCDFCDGDKMESMPWLIKLNKLLSEMNIPGQLQIGYNGCGRSCYGAVMEDIGVVYFRGEFEVHAGGKKTGRNVRLPLFSEKNLSGEEMISKVESVLRHYKKEAFEGEKFFKFILR